MILNEYGEIAENTWNDLPKHHSNIKLSEFIVMPNHIHGILKIMDVNFDVVTDLSGVAGNAPTCDMRMISPKSGTISTIVRSYKSSVTKQINDHRRGVACNAQSIWQRNYHERIIRNKTEYAKITEYIRNNPILWEK